MVVPAVFLSYTEANVADDAEGCAVEHTYVRVFHWHVWLRKV